MKLRNLGGGTATQWNIIVLLYQAGSHGQQCYICTKTDLITAVRELFRHTAVPGIFWSNSGPEFTTEKFQIFTHSADLDIRHPLLNIHRVMGRLRWLRLCTVKVMKRSFMYVTWNERYLARWWNTVQGLVLQYQNTPCIWQRWTQKLFDYPIQDTMQFQHNAEEV